MDDNFLIQQRMSKLCKMIRRIDKIEMLVIEFEALCSHKNDECLKNVIPQLINLRQIIKNRLDATK